MTGPHKSRKAGPCHRCHEPIAIGQDYYAGRAICGSWRTRFATERICVRCAVNMPIVYARGFGPGDGDSKVIEP